jgi:ABC-2 type transport system ATP-binding protein
MLQFKKYKKFYDKELILEIEDTILEDGVYWIKGDNGSGKSTLMKSIAGLIPFEGEINLSGLSNNQKNLMEYRRIVNYGEAEPVYPEFLKGSDLVALYQNIKGGSAEQLTSLLTRLGVKKFQSKETGAYSSGMAKKLSLVLAFIGTPKLILLDEPLITLDKETTGIVMELITEYAAQGVSIIFTSHQEFKDKMSFPLHTLLLNNHSLNR